jgi:hypothetical protein
MGQIVLTDVAETRRSGAQITSLLGGIFALALPALEPLAFEVCRAGRLTKPELHQSHGYETREELDACLGVHADLPSLIPCSMTFNSGSINTSKALVRMPK